MLIDPLHAVTRFGLGPSGTEPPPDDPLDWLRGQLGDTDPVRFAPALPSAAVGLAALRQQRQTRPPPGQSLVAPLYRADSAAQLAVLRDTPAPFRERLVWFWANHFTVSIRRGELRPIAGAFVREAIRPHVCGRFGDMLLAVMRHPAMLLYLDNARSVGPGSPAGQDGRHGLNENLARESLELHTLSPAAGYSQADVTAYAAILTGWSVDMRAPEPGFLFRPRAHQPGNKRLLGRDFPEGERGGLLAIGMLGTHPATFRHLAAKLATHFVSDAPSPATVARLAGVLERSGGDLRAVSLALLALPEAWTPGTKFRTPFDLVAASSRLLGLGAEPPQQSDGQHGEGQHGEGQHDLLAGGMAALGQPVWTAPLPNGWPDRAADWNGPEAMLARINWSYRIAGRAQTLEPAEIADRLGDTLRPATRVAIATAGDRRDALTLLLSSPEFQRR